jgi:hypothetical protein
MYLVEYHGLHMKALHSLSLSLKSMFVMRNVR